MSIQAIRNYQREVEEIIQYSGKRNERIISPKFIELLNVYCEKRKLRLIPEFSFKNKAGKTIRPDGTVRSALQIDYGYWESKDECDDLEEEIQKKFKSGYPKTNILFEDSITAILIQEGEEVMRASFSNAKELDKLLNQFVSYQHPEVQNFNQAVEQFKTDIPRVVAALQEMIKKQTIDNQSFIDSRNVFFELCKHSINPIISIEDINEMLIQHILTEEIFMSIFSDTQLIKENNIAKSLYEVENTFFVGQTKRQTLESLRNYYEVIKVHAAAIADHHQKQTFLKVIYENFYQAYNPNGADRLGIVYTPNEIVQFQIKSVDYLLHKHFNTSLASEKVEILDPATGTGTYICELIEYLPKQYVAQKYATEIHANEVAILPYYIANLNIEYTYRQKMGVYEEFKNLCFVDTLDNVAALGYEGKMNDMYGFSAENAQRIKDQNQRKISVIIGNPPYNAKQIQYNQQNANYLYKEIDERINTMYAKTGTAQNRNQLYDMYIRFFRWASDRIKDEGVITFITNNSFLEAMFCDGMRKSLSQEFQAIYVVNLRGNSRVGKEDAKKEGENVFNIRVGVSITFLVKNTKRKQEFCDIQYYEVEDFASKKEKLDALTVPFEDFRFRKIAPDEKQCWINKIENDYESSLPLISKDTKNEKEDNAIFKLFSRGLSSGRQEWCYDKDKTTLKNKIQYFIDIYNQVRKSKKMDWSIKWDRELVSYLKRAIPKRFVAKQIKKSLFRPFVKNYLYFDKHLNQMSYQWYKMYQKDGENRYIIIPGLGSTSPFTTLVSEQIVDLNAMPAGCQCLPLYSYQLTKTSDNITDWGLEQFRKYYSHVETQNIASLQKEDIFYYVYAVLHNPAYRKKYELNLKREFPRIPFYSDFEKWSSWGKELMDLHLNYENVEPFELAESTLPKFETLAKLEKSKVKLKVNKDLGEIVIDEQTTLSGIPLQAFEYQLGTRSALEWILDQYKEKEPQDETIKAQFHTYQFADYKEQVIDLLKRVCTVSIKTVEIMKSMNE